MVHDITHAHDRGLVRGGDRLAPGDAVQGAVNVEVEELVDEPHRPIAQGGMTATDVLTGRSPLAIAPIPASQADIRLRIATVNISSTVVGIIDVMAVTVVIAATDQRNTVACQCPDTASIDRCGTDPEFPQHDRVGGAIVDIANHGRSTPAHGPHAIDRPIGPTLPTSPLLAQSSPERRMSLPEITTEMTCNRRFLCETKRQRG